MLDTKDYTQIGLESNPSNATILTLHTPYKAQRLELQLANGLDSLIESKDREQNLDSLLTLKLINGGYKEKYWSFGEGVEENTQANLLHTNTESKESKETQENKDKEILEIYFSYGEECERLQEDSRHTQDVNLHIKTQGYSNGEEIHITLEIQGEKLSVSGIIQDNQAIIMNVLSSKGK